MSIKYKIALLFALLVTLILAIISLSIYFTSAAEREDTFKTRLLNRALSTAKVYADLSGQNFSLLRRMDTAAVASLYNKSITIARANGTAAYMFSDIPGDSFLLTREIIEQTKKDKVWYFPYKNKKAVALHYQENNNDFIAAVASSDLDGEEFLRQLKEILLGAILLAVILSFFTGLLFAKNIIRPVKIITSEVNLISSNNLSQRIKINNARDELTRLAQTFNSLLDRLQDSFAIQRRFISNASHELSTPLTSISSQVEVALHKNRTEEEYRDVLQSVYEDIREVQLLTRSLLDIAKAGSHGSIDLHEVRFDEVLFKVMSDVQKQNAGFKVQLDMETFPDDERLLTVFGNANMLYIVLKNIIENGCKYSDNNQSTLTGEFGQKQIILKVANKGDVIAESDIQNIFQPFFRTNSAQAKQGFGLGLTLARRILSLHKGIITVESNLDIGTVFTIQLPNFYQDNNLV